MRIAIHDYAGHPFQFELSRELAKRGHDVCHFFFDADIGPKGATQIGPDDPTSFSIRPVTIDSRYSKSNFIQRLLGDIRYGAAISKMVLEFRPDVIISGNSPLEVQRQLLRAARRGGVPFVFWMQDFYSLAISSLLSDKWSGLGMVVARYYRRMERYLLCQSDQIILIGETFVPTLATFGDLIHKTSIIPNWGAINTIPVCEKESAWAQDHALANRFVFLYSGTMALKHDPELIWRLAIAFHDDPNVAIVIAATGISVDLLKERQHTNPQPNLVFLPLQSADHFPALLGAANVLIALLVSDAGEFSVPSKILSYLCADRPILLSAPNHNPAAVTVAKAGAGLIVDADNPDAFVAAARTLRQNETMRRALGAAGRRYAEETFDIKAVADKFCAVIRSAQQEQLVPNINR
jgi:glycosyltransferase involved in cell wall biosynthesis